MSGRYFLDTNIMIALFANETVIRENIVQDGEVFIPNIVVGELCYGARKLGRVLANLAKIDELVANSKVLDCNIETAWAKQLNKIVNKMIIFDARFLVALANKNDNYHQTLKPILLNLLTLYFVWLKDFLLP
ncbi:MAG: PIN domain-containing protein [Trichodesmium sp.]